MKNAPGREHVSVMESECLNYFSDCKLHSFFEGTLGAGGHAKAILQAHPEIEHYIGCDQDPEALEIAGRVLAPWKDKVEFVHDNFVNLDQILNKRKMKQVDGFFLT